MKEIGESIFEIKFKSTRLIRKKFRKDFFGKLIKWTLLFVKCDYKIKDKKFHDPSESTFAHYS